MAVTVVTAVTFSAWLRFAVAPPPSLVIVGGSLTVVQLMTATSEATCEPPAPLWPWSSIVRVRFVLAHGGVGGVGIGQGGTAGTRQQSVDLRHCAGQRQRSRAGPCDRDAAEAGGRIQHAFANGQRHLDVVGGGIHVGDTQPRSVQGERRLLGGGVAGWDNRRDRHVVHGRDGDRHGGRARLLGTERALYVNVSVPL